MLLCIPFCRLDKIFKSKEKRCRSSKYIELGLSDPAHGCLPSFFTSPYTFYRLALGKKTRKGLPVHTLVGFFLISLLLAAVGNRTGCSEWLNKPLN